MKKMLFIIIAVLCLPFYGIAQQIRPENVSNDNFVSEQMPEIDTENEAEPASLYDDSNENELTVSARAAATPATVGQNYVSTAVYNTFGGSVGYHQTQYIDGLGRQMETVYKMYTPNKKDLVSLKEYVPAFRRNSSWLPVPTANTDGSYIEREVFKTQGQAYYNNEPLFCTWTFLDILDRINYEYKPGMNKLNKPATYGYGMNSAAEEIRKITFTTKNDSLVMDVSGIYPDNSLYFTRAADEDGKMTCTYTDKSGRIVMVSTGNARTYYGYDAFGRLSVVITPEGSRAMASARSSSVAEAPSRIGSDGESQVVVDATIPDPKNIGMNSSFVKGYCYYYRYDGLGNQIERKFPGGILEEMEYNDNNQITTRFRGKVDSRSTVEYADRYLYDNFGRLTDIKKASYSIVNGTRTATLETPQSLVSYQYDSYSSEALALAYKDDLIAGLVGVALDRNRVKGMKTYEKIRVIKESDQTAGYVERTFYYDKSGRPLQTVEKNHLGGISYFTNAYDFQGNVVYHRERIQPKAGATQDVLTVQYTYDHAGRLITEKTDFNNTLKPVTTTYTYNELGQLTRINNNGLIEDYTYNLQGWLTTQLAPYYSAELKYYDSSNPSYTGNITEWKSGAHTYKFTYDNQGRITDAVYSGESLDKYSEKGITYDRNGNILTLKRYSDDAVSEDLKYGYAGGRLAKIGTSSYVYDRCGNMIRDGRNNLDISYNFINLPSQIASRSDNKYLNYHYLADGTKFAALDANKTGLIYIGSLVYQMTGGTAVNFESAAFNKGRFRMVNSYSGKTCLPEYYVTDHLGSRRAMFDYTGELMVLREYYPFGKTWNRAHAQVTSDPYCYNGKEEQPIGKAGLLDYGARFYDPGIGRWITQDPLSEMTPGTSPYTFCLNNPVKFIDPQGLSPVYSTAGRLLGTDDNGLQGPAIVMDQKNFKQGMKHDEAVLYDLGTEGFLGEWAFNRFQDSFSGLSSRPDWDGYLTLDEATYWYRYGNGEPLFVDFSRIDLSSFSHPGDEYIGKSETINLLMNSGTTFSILSFSTTRDEYITKVNNGLVFGSITIKYYPDNKVRAFADKYDFDYKPFTNLKNCTRNAFNFLGSLVAGKGTPYWINLYGSQTLKSK